MADDVFVHDAFDLAIRFCPLELSEDDIGQVAQVDLSRMHFAAGHEASFSRSSIS